MMHVNGFERDAVQLHQRHRLDRRFPGEELIGDEERRETESANECDCGLGEGVKS